MIIYRWENKINGKNYVGKWEDSINKLIYRYNKEVKDIWKEELLQLKDVLSKNNK
jgi:hypothetical protein